MDQACAWPAPCRGLSQVVLTAEPQRRQSANEAKVHGEEFSMPEPRLPANQTHRHHVHQRVDQYQPSQLARYAPAEEFEPDKSQQQQ